MNPASFIFLTTLIAAFHALKSESGTDIPKPNPFGSITNVQIKFTPSFTITEFVCMTRYNVTGSQPISLYYNDQLIHSVDNGNYMSHKIKNAEPGEYRFKVGSDDEFKFQFSRQIKDVIELVINFNLINGQMQIEYESSELSNNFVCEQNNFEMQEGYHDIIAGIENKGYNGTAEPKTKESYKCYINNDQYEFSAMNNVEDKYPRISTFRVQLLPMSRDQDGSFKLYVSCRTRTAKSPKILLFTNQYDLVETNVGNFALYKSGYKNESAFKCIVENDYGRDVISWDAQSLLDHLNPKDSFTYVADADKQIATMTYKSGELKNLADVMCMVKEKNKLYQYKTITNEKEEKVFIEAIDKYIQYTCKLAGKKEFESSLYTKDWLKVPKVNTARFTARIKPDKPSSPYWLTIYCSEAIKTATYAISLFDGYTRIKTLKHFYSGMPQSIHTELYEINRLTTARCIIENDMGYDTITAIYVTQVPKVSSMQFTFSTLKTGEINSELGYMRPGENMHHTTNCSRNEGHEHPVASSDQYFFRRDYEEFGKYFCKNKKCPNNAEPTCFDGYEFFQFRWYRKSVNYFPNGTLLKEEPVDQFESFFGFYNQTFNETQEDLLYSQLLSSDIN